LEDLCAEEWLGFAPLLITDVVSNGSLLLLSHESEAWDDINYPCLDRSLYSLPDIVSRKKQLLPLRLANCSPPPAPKKLPATNNPSCSGRESCSDCHPERKQKLFLNKYLEN
jgi:hypothetical protein